MCLSIFPSPLQLATVQVEIAEVRAQLAVRDAERMAWERALRDAYCTAGRDVAAAAEAAALRGQLATREAELDGVKASVQATVTALRTDHARARSELVQAQVSLVDRDVMLSQALSDLDSMRARILAATGAGMVHAGAGAAWGQQPQSAAR